MNRCWIRRSLHLPGDESLQTVNECVRLSVHEDKKEFFPLMELSLEWSTPVSPAVVGVHSRLRQVLYPRLRLWSLGAVISLVVVGILSLFLSLPRDGTAAGDSAGVRLTGKQLLLCLVR